MEAIRREETRIRMNFKVSAKGTFQPDITSEAETVETVMKNMNEAYTRLLSWAAEKGMNQE